MTDGGGGEGGGGASSSSGAPRFSGTVGAGGGGMGGGAGGSGAGGVGGLVGARVGFCPVHADHSTVKCSRHIHPAHTSRHCKEVHSRCKLETVRDRQVATL